MAAAVALAIAFCSLYTVAQAVPIYLYSGPAFNWVRNCSVNHAKELKGLRESLYAGKVLFQERLQQYPERVLDKNWQDAELFVVPVLTVLAYWEAWGPGSGCNGVSLRQQLDVTGKALLASPYFRAKGGRDHLVLAGHSGLKYVDRGLQPPTYFAMALANMTVARYETLDTHSRSRPWRCSVAVPYSHKAHAPTIDRHITHAGDEVAGDRGMFFMGATGDLDAAPDLDLRREVAEKVMQLTEYNMTFVSTVDDPLDAGFPRCVNCSYHNTFASALYEQRLRRSKFALIMTSGNAPNSRRIFDAFAHGVVPIVISDRPWHVAMPFAFKVPWRDLVYSLGEHFTEEELRRILATSRKTTARKRNLINFYLRDLSWTAPGSRVADNVLLEALRHCI